MLIIPLRIQIIDSRNIHKYKFADILVKCVNQKEQVFDIGELVLYTKASWNNAFESCYFFMPISPSNYFMLSTNNFLLLSFKHHI